MMIGNETKQGRKCVPTLDTFLGTHTMLDHSFVIKTLDTKEMLGVHGLITSEGSPLDCEILQKVGEEEPRRDQNADMARDDPLLLGGEEGEIAPIRSTLKSLRVIPHYHETSTQKTEMNLRSGSRDMMTPSLMHMGMIHETSLSCGKPPGRPLDLDLVKYVSHLDAPFIYPRRKGALEYDHT